MKRLAFWATDAMPAESRLFTERASVRAIGNHRIESSVQCYCGRPLVKSEDGLVCRECRRPAVNCECYTVYRTAAGQTTGEM